MKKLNIATVCFLDDTDRLLVVRKQGTTAWMLPGGKLDAQETPKEALIREVWEELRVKVSTDTLKPLGSFSAVAANEENTEVFAHAFVGELPNDQTPKNSAEIAEIMWLPLNATLPVPVAPLLKEHIIPTIQALRKPT